MQTNGHTNGIAIVFRTKRGAEHMDMNDLATAKKGGSGWWIRPIKKPEEKAIPISVTFTDSPDGSGTCWIPVTIQQQIRDERKRQRREYAERNRQLRIQIQSVYHVHSLNNWGAD